MIQSKSKTVYRLVILSVILFSFCIACVSAHPYGTETRVPYIKSANQQHVALYGRKIVWDDPDSAGGDIFLYDISTGNITRITSDPNPQEYPAIYDNHIVWQDKRVRDRDIYLYDLSDSSEQRITSAIAGHPSYPAVYSDKIVWQDDRNGDWDIYMYDLSAQREYLITPGTTGSDQTLPAIYGDRIVWQDTRNPSGLDIEIYMNDTSTWTESLITPDNGLGVGADGSTDGIWQSAPAISGERIVWEDYRYLDPVSSLNVPNIFMFRIGGEESRVSTNLSAAYLPASYLLNNLMFPSVAGNRVVWRDFQNRTAGDIFLNDTSAVPPRQIQVSSGTNEKSKPQISDDRIAWTETSGAVQEIHLFTVGTPQECPVVTFTKSTTGGGAPLSVRFSDSTGTVRASHWYWDFGDGSVSYEQNPVHGFAANGQYLTNLTISDDYCRIMSSSQQITVGSPVADFSANTTSGIVPLSVTFSDLSSGSPASWAWDFENDGVTDSNSQNPTRLYTTPGTYTVKLTATNAYGSSTKTRTGYISVLAGAHATATIPVNGIATDNRFGDQFLAYDSSRTGVPVLDPAHIILVSHPGGSGGWQNITFESADTIGFSNAGNGTYFGNVSQTSFQTSVVETTGFLATIGDPVFVNYRMVLPDYPAAASLVTEVWENAIAEDNTSLSTIALSGGFTGVDATGYTARYKRNSLGTIGTATINMSAGSAWVAGADGPAIGRDKTYILAIGSDPSTGNKNGMVLDLVYTCSDASLDYFEAAIPASYSYLSTFIIAKLSGTGNPFQMITLSIASRIGPTTGSDSGDVGAPAGQGQGAGKGTVSPPPQGPNAPPAFNAPPESVDPGQTASLYANTQGVVTQATTLQSTDRVATISISEGVVAMDSTGSPLSSVSVTALPAGNLPAPSSNPAHSFSGVAYELQPEGATFSPAIIISFAYPKAQWGQEYMIKSFDHKTDTWQDLQTRYDPQTGKIMAEVSHFCCFALFSTPVMPETIPVTARPTPMVTETKQVLPPPTAAVGIFLNMMAWLTDFLKNNLVLLVVAILLAVLMYAMRRKKRMDRIRYML